MALDEVSVATAALVIAIVALLIACGQLIGQLFGTADGHRRCQSSVIGDWSRLASLRFRWSSFRLEVRVTTPHFEICQLDKARRLSLWPHARPMPSSAPIDKTQRVAITGSADSRRRTLSRVRRSRYLVAEDDQDEDLVSWSSLLAGLHDRQELQFIKDIGHRQTVDAGAGYPGVDVDIDAFKTMDQRHALVCIKPKTRSWDLMPPDVVRPMASTNLGTLITIAHRMGMVWQDFIPREGKLLAEGVNQSLSATLMRGLGLVVEYYVEPQYLVEKGVFRSLYVPSIDADKMACGIIPGNDKFGTWDLYLRTGMMDSDPGLISIALKDLQLDDKNVIGAFKSIAFNDLQLDIEKAISDFKKITQNSSTEDDWPAFSDILGLWSDWVPLNGSLINSVLSPIGHRVHTMSEAYEARVVWRWLLQEQENQGNISSLRRRVLRLYDSWEADEPRRFYFNPGVNDAPYNSHNAFFKSIYDVTTSYFEKIIQKTREDFYLQLVASHVHANAKCFTDATSGYKTHFGKRPEYELEINGRIKAVNSRMEGRVGYKLPATPFTMCAFIYADNIPNVVSCMRQRGQQENFVEDAWWMLMLRGQCFEMGLTRVVQKSCVPSSYYNSPTRVYIL
ncbi:hypothetical protein EJ02DRAFT_514653 [Clathrospora elynae]|uniref:Uncharacterized protein n=1 Tax=Clathrospora elynae TaxID=706981 RepID=A0A6A5SF39_9PLEO|nr:hypothetical protein EJ02DRAFT_514653 [Clathrospora elynae]